MVIKDKRSLRHVVKTCLTAGCTKKKSYCEEEKFFKLVDPKKGVNANGIVVPIPCCQ